MFCENMEEMRQFISAIWIIVVT